MDSDDDDAGGDMRKAARVAALEAQRWEAQEASDHEMAMRLQAAEEARGGPEQAGSGVAGPSGGTPGGRAARSSKATRHMKVRLTHLRTMLMWRRSPLNTRRRSAHPQPRGGAPPARQV